MKEIVVKLDFDKRKYTNFKRLLGESLITSSKVAQSFIKKSFFLINEKNELSMNDLGYLPRTIYDSIKKTNNSYKNLSDLKINYSSIDKLIIFRLTPTKDWSDKHLNEPYDFVVKSLSNLDTTILSQIFQKAAREYIW
jgi:hypothetical protein